MRVFLCWSGTTSLSIATAMKQFLGDVIQELKPFLSTESIRKGDRWRSDIAQQLAETEYGILCLTKDNLKAPWILFEAGALSKNISQGRVTALLTGIQAVDVIEPLSQFQHTRADRVEIWKLLQEMNELLPPEKRLEAKRLERYFEQFWPAFENKLLEALKVGSDNKNTKPKRSVEDMIAEVLELVRDMKRSTDVRREIRARWPVANTIFNRNWSLLDAASPKDLTPEQRKAIEKSVETYQSAVEASDAPPKSGGQEGK